MKFIQVDETNKVTFIHNMPFDEQYGMKMSEEELLKIGKLVPDFEDPQPIEGKIFTYKYNAEQNVVEFEWMDRPKTPEELLEERLANLETQTLSTDAALIEELVRRVEALEAKSS
ncbi:MAG: hypothetical protein ACRC5C_13605 [Bacilli bacterium]